MNEPDLGVDGGWTASAEAWVELAPDDTTRKFLLDPVVLEEAGEVAGERVLDVGCGEGRFSRLLVARGAHTVGVDPIRLMLKAARRRAGAHEQYALAAGEALPFA